MSRRNRRVTKRIEKRTPKRQDTRANKPHTTKQFSMDGITQKACQCQRIWKQAEKKRNGGDTAQSQPQDGIQAEKRYDGTLESLKDRSRAPHRNVRRQAEGSGRRSCAMRAHILFSQCRGTQTGNSETEKENAKAARQKRQQTTFHGWNNAGNPPTPTYMKAVGEKAQRRRYGTRSAARRYTSGESGMTGRRKT